LVSELETKREKVASVSHTDVKELKEMHLASKSLKSELAALATRRFLRAREASQERVVEILTEWARSKLQDFVRQRFFLSFFLTPLVFFAS
jgi:hypothetical protein